MLSESPAKRSSLKIVFDTNIYISSFLKSGFSRELLNLAFLKKFDLFCSQEILLELQEKLIKKFQVPESDIRLFIKTISKIAQIVTPSQKLNLIKTDPEDNIILECGEKARANLIISNDKHLLRLKKYRKIGIIHPKTLVWIMPEEFKK